MALESGTYISSLNAANPVATDGISESDNHLRLLKSTILATFPSVTGAINATHTEINTATDGSTAATSTTLVDADRMVVNDDGTMAQVALSDLRTYLTSNLAITSSMITDGTIATDDISDNAITAAKLASGAAFSAGMLMPFAGASAPTGWLLAFGQNVSRSTYADLFTAIGTTYGIGDGSSTFALPDLRGRTIAGQDDMGGSAASRLTDIDGSVLGGAGGSETHALTEAELASHTHFVAEDGTYNGGGWGLSSTLPIREGVPNDNPDNHQYVLKSGDSTADVGLSSATGSGTAHNNMQPTIILNYIIKI